MLSYNNGKSFIGKASKRCKDLRAFIVPSSDEQGFTNLRMLPLDVRSNEENNGHPVDKDHSDHIVCGSCHISCSFHILRLPPLLSIGVRGHVGSLRLLERLVVRLVAFVVVVVTSQRSIPTASLKE